MTEASDLSPGDWVRETRMRRDRRRFAALVGLVGLVLLGLAMPRLVGEAGVLEPRSLLWSIRVDPAAIGGAEPLLAAATAIERAAPLVGDGRLTSDGGLLLMRAALLSPHVEERRRLLQAAAQVGQDGLRKSPVDPSAWTRLSFVRRELGDPKAAAAALRMSMLTGAVLPQVMADRLALAFDLLPYFDEDGRALVQRQVRLLREIQPESLAKLAGRSPAARAFIGVTGGD